MTYGIWKIFVSFALAMIITIFIYLNIRQIIPGAELISLFFAVVIYAGFTRLFRL